MIFANVGGNHFPDLPILQNETETNSINAGIVTDDGEIPNASLAQGSDEIFRDAAQTKTANHYGRAVRNIGNGFLGIPYHLIQVEPPRLKSFSSPSESPRSSESRTV